MIHYKENDDLEMEGTGGELLTEAGIIFVNVIKAMINTGLPKDLLLLNFMKQ